MRGSLKASPRKPEREPARTRKPAEAGSAAGVTLPLWYWAPFDHFSHGLTAHGVQLGYFPNGPYGPGAAGVYVDTLPKALLTALVCLLLLVPFSYLLVLTRPARPNAPCTRPRRTTTAQAPRPPRRC